uniref:Si:ch211-242b18.1 n=1 Tax=Cynoglossus semilaevis TaxID=244447 RepID=A0A3P8UIK7_CYNSE
MKEVCRICARELLGNQRRWIFHPTAKLNLQVLLSHALGHELTRDGRGEFVCSKCAFMLDRMYRFDTVIARVEALSLERLHKLLLEKERLRQCIGGLYLKNNVEDGNVAPAECRVEVVVTPAETPVVDLSNLQNVRYSDMIQEDLAFSVYESWADKEEPALDHHVHHCEGGDSLSGQRPRRCRGCAALRVADSDYEAVCKVPRKLGRRSTSCGPSTRYSSSTQGVEELNKPCGGSEATTLPFDFPPTGPAADNVLHDQKSPSPASSVESLDTTVAVDDKLREETELDRDPEESPTRRDIHWGDPPFDSFLSGLEEMLSLLRGWEYQPVKPQRGSKLPVLVKARLEQSVFLRQSISLRSPCGAGPDPEVFSNMTVPQGVTPCLQTELAEMEEQWSDDYVQCRPFRFQQLGHYESAVGQCVSELLQAQQQVSSLQAKIRESEARNQKLQERLCGMELELHSAQEEAQQQERNIQNISDVVSSKEAEASELYRVIEEQNKMLCSLKNLSNRQHLQQPPGPEGVHGHREVLTLQASLFQAQLELQAGERLQQQAARMQEDLSRALQRLEDDLQGALQHRRDTDKHNQELQMALEKTRKSLQEKEAQLRESEWQIQREREEREKSIRELRTSLQTKEQLLEDYCDLLEEHQTEKRDSLLQKLHQRIRDRDRALERAVDEKFHCVEEREEEARRLQLLLREKERDLERQRCVLLNNEETIISLEVLVRGKAVELEQVSEAWRNLQRQQVDREEKQRDSLRERDTIISQLQGALHTRTQETQDLRCSLLAQIHAAPTEVLEELKVRLQLKDRLFQEVLADRTRQAQQHQQEVQSLMMTISSRDQYIQDCGRRLGEVMNEQTSRLQELRRQLSSGLGSKPDCGTDSVLELQALEEELCLALRREKENQELSRSQAATLDSFSRTLQVKEQIIRDLQSQMVDPSDLPLVERLTQELQTLRENLVEPDVDLPAGGPDLRGHNRPGGRQPEFGGSEDEEDDQLNSDEGQRKVKSLSNPQGCGAPETAPLNDLLLKGQSLLEVQQLVEQKRAVERELVELKAQLEKTGFSSLSQIRRALFSLQTENDDLKRQLTEGRHVEQKNYNAQQAVEEVEAEEEELDVTIEGVEVEEELWETWDSELPPPHANIQSEEKGGSQTSTHESELRLTNSSQAKEPRPSMQQAAACHDSLQQKSRELKERLMVSEATVQVQAEQLKDYRQLLNAAAAEGAVQQDSKLVQVDLQDLGYETCGRSENEAEREDTSSPEFDDLEMCTSLDCGSQWWPSSTSTSTFTKATNKSSSSGDEVSSLQRLVEDLRSQLSRSQGVIRGLHSRLRSLSTSNHCENSTPRKVNWSFQASPSQSGTEDDEGWQSSDGGPLPSPGHSHSDKGLQELVSRIDALENQLRKGGKKCVEQEEAPVGQPSKLDSLIQAQARELSHLRQRLREGRSVCNILTQHLGDTTKAFEELLRANDIDYYMGQSFRDQLAQSSSLAQRVGAKISGRDHAEDPEEKTELLAIRLSKELQQKDKVIESLRAKLNQQHHHLHDQGSSHRSDTPCSSHALSDATDQSDRISYISDERGSTNEDLELCSELDAANEISPEDTPGSSRVSTDCHSHSSTVSHHPSVPPSIASSHRTQSCLSCPSMHCTSSPHRPVDIQSMTGFSTPQSKPLRGFPFTPQQSNPSAFLPLSFHGYQPSPFTSSLDGTLAMKAGSSLLESSALWDMAYDPRSGRLGANLSSGSSGYQSAVNPPGSDLMQEHLREVRGLRQRLEDSIQTNDRLRQKLEDRLAHTPSEKGAPTNIYIQGLDSIGQLSSEVRLLKEENTRLQQTTAEGNKEVAQLRETALQERAKLKKAELELEKWSEQSRKLQAEAESHNQEVLQLKQEKQRSQDTINRLHHEVSVLQQQLGESRSLVQTLQAELLVYSRGRRQVGGASDNVHTGNSTNLCFDPRELHVQLEQQLSGQPGAKRALFNDNVPSPPVRDTGLTGLSSPTHTVHRGAEEIKRSESSSDLSHVVGHVDDFSALQQQILEGRALLCKMEAALHVLSVPTLQELSLHQPSCTSVSDTAAVTTLLSDTKTLRQILEEAASLLRRFCTTNLPKGTGTKEEDSLKEELSSLRLKLSEQEQVLKDTVERLQSSNRTKDSMEHFIISQLSRTRDVLRKAKTNLQENKCRISSLHQASFSTPSPSSSSFFSSPSSSSSSSPLWPVKGSNTGGFCRLSFSPGRSVMTKEPQTSTFLLPSPSSAVQAPVHIQRPLQAAVL